MAQPSHPRRAAAPAPQPSPAKRRAPARLGRQPQRLHALAWAALGAIAAAGPARAVTFNVTDLGVAGQALALNNSGQVVGSFHPGVLPHAFSWTAAGGLVDIHYTSAGPDAQTWARAVNDTGTVALDLDLGGGYAYGMTWRSGTPHALLPTGWAPAYQAFTVTGLNNAGTLVGTANGPGQAPLSYLSSLALPANTGPLPAQPGDALHAQAISDSGAVTGSYTHGLASGGFLWTPGGGQVLVNSLDGVAHPLALNERDQVVGFNLADGREQAFIWQAGSGVQSLGLLAGNSRAQGINRAGQVVGSSTAGANGGLSGGFLWTARDGVQDLNSLLTPGSSTQVLKANAINQAGQIAGQASNGHALLLTPTGELAWRGAAGGQFDDGRNWALGLSPSAFVDAQVFTTGLQTITLAHDSAVNSLGLGAASGGRPTLRLQDGAVLSATYGVTVRATGTLLGDGQVQGAVLNQGTVLGSSLRISGGLQNQGLVGVQAGTPGRLETDLDNQAGGQLRLAQAERLQLVGSAHVNQGTVELRGGELAITGTLDNSPGGRVLLGQGAVLRLHQGLANAGQVAVGFGGAEVFGTVQTTAGGQLLLSGNSNTTFYDAVTVDAGGELRVSAGSTALFFGPVRQRTGALFTGTGTRFYEGSLSVGDSPGLGRDEGSVVLGTASRYLAELGGTSAGTGFDKLVVGGGLHFGGTLVLQAWGGFAAQAGQRFDLFDWGSSSGQFSTIDATGLALGDGLVLDTSRLYVDGSLGIAAVPEPAVWWLLLCGVPALRWQRQRQRPPQ